MAHAASRRPRRHAGHAAARRRSWPAWLVWAPLVLTGCATVEPQADYDHTAEQIRAATGSTEVFDPQRASEIQARVTALLAGGITIEEAVGIALLNNPRLQAAFYDIGMARADVVQAGLLSNPTLGVALRLPSAGGLANLEAELAQNIADLWQIPPRQRAAKRDLDRTILTVARQASQLAADAKTAYFAALGSAQRLRIARENLTVAQTVLELADFRKQAGAGNQLDVNLARGVVLESELAVQNAAFAAAQARRDLARVLGLAGSPEGLILADALPDQPMVALNADDLVSLALSKRLDVRASTQAVQSSEERLLLQQRRVFPNVSVGVALERGERGRAAGRDLLADTARASVAAGALTAPEIEPRPNPSTDLIIGPSLSLELPIFDQNQAQIARAAYELEQAQCQLQWLQRSIEQDVRSAVDRAGTAWGIANFYRNEVMPQAEANLDLAQDAYHAGRSTILAILDAERTLLSTRDSYAVALLQAAATIPEIEQTVGVPFQELIRPAADTQPAAISEGE